MTDEMLNLALENQRKAGVENGAQKPAAVPQPSSGSD